MLPRIKLLDLFGLPRSAPGALGTAFPRYAGVGFGISVPTNKT
jgi:hypothetical protein